MFIEISCSKLDILLVDYQVPNTSLLKHFSRISKKVGKLSMWLCMLAYCSL